MKIAVGASSFADKSDKAMNILLEHGIEVKKNPFGRKMTESEIIEHLQGVDGLLAGLEPLNDNVFNSCPQLKAIARIGIGMDNVDLDAAKQRGIKVSNTPDAPTEAVAEMCLSALLTIAHQIIPADRDMHNGIWKKRIGFSINGANVLIIGYGRIGQRTAGLMKDLGANIAVYDKYVDAACTCTLEEGLKWADVVSLHAAGTETILSENEFELCHNGIVVLNSARGGLIDEAALYKNLQNGRIGWYWGDAFWAEPYNGMLISCPNAILTPHISTYNTKCREDMETAAVCNLLEDLNHVPK